MMNVLVFLFFQSVFLSFLDYNLIMDRHVCFLFNLIITVERNSWIFIFICTKMTSSFSEFVASIVRIQKLRTCAAILNQ